jgi:predicted cupin superfamily sugar epimerase
VNPSAASLIRALALVRHPEGGWYRETFRSPRTVIAGGSERSALTTILYLLADGGHSRWHRVEWDEVWHFHDGEPLELFQLDPDGSGDVCRMLTHAGDGAEPVAVVPARHWQAARSTGGWSLVSCTMGPGFEFSELTLLRDHPAEAAALAARHPAWSTLI